MVIVPQDKVDYASLIMLETILKRDYEDMGDIKFIKKYKSKRYINKVCTEWGINTNIASRFIKAYLEYTFKDINFKPSQFKSYIVQEDYYLRYDDKNLAVDMALIDAIPCFRKHGFIYTDVMN